MKPDPKAAASKDGTPVESLTNVLGQSEQVKDLVVEAAEELSSVNTALKQELAAPEPLPGVENALRKSEAVEDKVQEASEKLSVVNRELKKEVKERHILEGQLAAVTEQGEADRHAALHDVLTGLPNRTLFNDRLEHGIAQARRHCWTLAVMFFDLDNFKTVNDTHGHDAGDSVLRTIATRLKEGTRSDDTVSRFGGDEFLYLLMEIRDEQNAASIAKKIIAAIQAPCDVSIGDRTVRLTVEVSVGIAVFPTGGETVDALIKSADTAMYQAKRTKSGYSFAR